MRRAASSSVARSQPRSCAAAVARSWLTWSSERSKAGRERLSCAVRDEVAGDREQQQDDDDDQPDVALRRHYSTTLREFRCAPTLRFTRWSALSTVLQSQSSFSPIAV